MLLHRRAYMCLAVFGRQVATQRHAGDLIRIHSALRASWPHGFFLLASLCWIHADRSAARYGRSTADCPECLRLPWLSCLLPLLTCDSICRSVGDRAAVQLLCARGLWLIDLVVCVSILLLPSVMRHRRLQAHLAELLIQRLLALLFLSISLRLCLILLAIWLLRIGLLAIGLLHIGFGRICWLRFGSWLCREIRGLRLRGRVRSFVW